MRRRIAHHEETDSRSVPHLATQLAIGYACSRFVGSDPTRGGGLLPRRTAQAGRVHSVRTALLLLLPPGRAFVNAELIAEACKALGFNRTFANLEDAISRHGRS